MADITILLNHSFLSPKVTAPLSHGLYWISCCGPCLSLLLPIWSSHSIPLVSDVLCALPTPHFCTWHPLHLECSSPCPWVPSFFFPTDLNLSFGSSIKSFLISAELCGCMFFFRCSPHIFFYGTDRLLLKKNFFFLMSVFPTRSQILSSICTVFSCSKYTGTCWVLDTSLNTERMKNILKSVITRVISLFIDKQIQKYFFGNTLETGVSVFSSNFHYATKYFLAHPLYIMNSLTGSSVFWCFWVVWLLVITNSLYFIDEE